MVAAPAALPTACGGRAGASGTHGDCAEPSHASIRPSQLTALETEEAVLRWSRLSPGLAGDRGAGPGRGRSAELSGRARRGGRKVRRGRAVSARGGAECPGLLCGHPLPCPGRGGRIRGRGGDRAGRMGAAPAARPGARSSAPLPAPSLWALPDLARCSWGIAQTRLHGDRQTAGRDPG